MASSGSSSTGSRSTEAGQGEFRRGRAAALVLFALLLLGLPMLVAATASPLLATLDAFYRAGALVFGGGHVVLPLLQSAVVDTSRLCVPTRRRIAGVV